MIKKELLFYSFLDFCKNKERIKIAYNRLTAEEIQLYKMYVYSIPFELEDIKDTMWEYLNDDEKSLFELMRKYRIKLSKNGRFKNEVLD